MMRHIALLLLGLACACDPDTTESSANGGSSSTSSSTGAGGAGSGAAGSGAGGQAGGAGGVGPSTSPTSGGAGGEGGEGGEGGFVPQCVDLSTGPFVLAESATQYAQYSSFTTPNVDGPGPDLLALLFYGPNASAPGLFDFSQPENSDWSLCERCILLSADNDSENGVPYIATSGTLEIDADADLYGGKLRGRLLDLTLSEAALVGDTLELVTPGKCRYIESAEMFFGAPDTWECAEIFYGTNDGCDCGCGAVDPDCASANVSACEYCEPASCANDGTDYGCELTFLDPMDNAQCVCSCMGVECGDDGCGTSCGSCTAPSTCDPTGQCSCTPSCGAAECGPNGCGGSCGFCGGNESCVAGMCECLPNACGGDCGACTPPAVCNGGQCCSPSCAGKQCGPDGCGGSCGTCAPGDLCTTAGTCCDTPAECFVDSQCCGGVCNIITDTCVNCFALGYPFCTEGSDCCSGLCDSGVCDTCLSNFNDCTSGVQCCSGYCGPSNWCTDPP